jgi:hypothetical protein
MKKIVWTFGLIAGAVLSLMMVVTIPFHEEIGFDRGLIIGYASMVAAFLLIFFGIRSYRDNVAGGSVSFGRALVVGALIAAVASACYVATWEVIYFNFSHDYLAKYQAHQIEKARASGASQAELDTQLADMKKFEQMYQNPAINAAITFVEPLPVGLLIALVSAAVLRKRRGSAAPGDVAAVVL